MEGTSGRPEITIGLIDGPVVINHPGLSGERIREVPAKLSGVCSQAGSSACMHGTFVAGILVGRRGSPAPAICPGCTLLLRPIFPESSREVEIPSTTPNEVAVAITDCVDAGAHVINLSVALTRGSGADESELDEALEHATSREVIVVAAAGNRGIIGGSAITRHPWVIPVASCNLRGEPLANSNFGASIGRRGLLAPGDAVTSLEPTGKTVTFGGTSAAAPFVTGAISLLWSEFPAATAAELRYSLTSNSRRRNEIVPPLMDAWAAYAMLSGG